MTEIRVYYECLEQAYDYIAPMIRSANCEVCIRLIKRVKDARALPEGSLRAIHHLVNPDILIAGVEAGKETPLVVIEFTDAVKTEDHELQRSYGAIAAYLGDAFYVKVSGFKESRDEFGGAEYNPYSTPRILRERLNYEGFILAEWEKEPDNPTRLRRSPGLPACPHYIAILNDTIQKSVEAFFASQENWYPNALRALKDCSSHRQFDARVSSAPTLEDLTQEWAAREARNRDLDKLRFFVRRGWVGAKINRFSHAMDPDRGILTFLSLIFSDERKVYGVYALVRPKSLGILKVKLASVSMLREKLATALQTDKGGLPIWLQQRLEAIAGKIETLGESIDARDLWANVSREQILKSRVVMTLAYLTDGIYLNQNGARLYWNKYALLGSKKGDFVALLKRFFGFDHLSAPSAIEQVLDEVDEDEVTYAIAHRVLLPNGFRIAFISYPGAQGGSAVLTDKARGLAQPRKYPDVVALPPEKAKTFDALMDENKGMFNEASAQADIRKLQEYQKSKRHKDALKNTLVRAQVFDKDDKLQDIVIGVGFGGADQITRWNPSKVDFIFRIRGRFKWSIGIFRQDLAEQIPTIEGDTNFPKRFRVVKTGQPKLFDSES